MKTQTLKKRLEKRYTGSKTAKDYAILKDFIFGTNKTGMVNDYTIRPVHTSGSGRFKSNLDYTENTLRTLKLLGIKFKFGNDAPRGGLTGNFIIILTKIERNILR